MAATGSSIYEVLARAGIERTRGKMTCSQCKARKVTASESKGIAKCWGCDAFWTLEGETVAPDRDWAIFLIGKIASRCQDHLPDCIEALDWLDYRRIPTKDSRWLADQDLGAVPLNFYVKDLVLSAGLLLNEAMELLRAKANQIMQSANGEEAKVLRDAQKKCDAIKIKIEGEEKEFTHLTQAILPRLLDPAWRNALVYIYRDADGQPCSLNVRQYASEPGERRVMRIQPRAGKRGVFGAGDAHYAVGEAWAKGMPALTIVEGEHNLLSLRGAVETWGLQYFISAIAIGGKNGADIACISTLADGDEPLIIYDNDKVNPKTGLPGGFELVDAIASKMYCHATTTPTKDLDDYIKAEKGLTPDKIYREVFSRSKPVPLNINTVRTMVEEYLCADGIESNAREIAVTNLIVRDIKRRTKLFNVDGYALLLLPAGDVSTEHISVRKGNATFHAFLRQYGISKTEWIDACGKTLNIEAAKRDTARRTLHSISAWVNGRLYLNCYEGSMIRISVEDRKTVLDRVPSGTDGVLMQRYAHSLTDIEAETRPWLNPNLDLSSITRGALKHRTDSALENAVLDRVNYMEQPGHYKQLLKCWILSTFFATTQKSRPVPMIEGNGGGGKTSLGVFLGNILLGEHFSATNPPTTGKELAELMTGVPFVVFDEWDSISKDVEKTFKHLTTGGKHRRRELYTTATVIELSCDATIMLTTNANPTREVATSRRFLVIPVAPRQNTAGERVFNSIGEHLLPGLMSMREAVWVELLSDLSACVFALHHSDSATKTSFSMADFGVFVQRIADYEGWGGAAHKMFVATEKKQEQQTADTQVLAELIPELLRVSPDLAGRYLTAREWSDYFQRVISQRDVERQRKVTPNYVGYILKTFADLYRRQFGLTSDIDKHTKTKRYALRMPEQDVAIHDEAEWSRLNR